MTRRRPGVPAQTSGYTGKPLAEKLGLTPELRASVIDPPSHYLELLDGLPAPQSLGVGPYDFVHVFAADRAALVDGLPAALERLAERGMIWVSWPKKASPLFQDLTENGIREIALPLGLVDIKVCAIDEDWSGLKLVRRVGNRAT
jgi:hypothetical protein